MGATEEQQRLLQFEFERGDAAGSLPRSIVMPQLESLGAVPVEAPDDSEAFRVDLDHGYLWVKLDPELTGFECLLPIGSSPEGVRAVRSLLDSWETASRSHTGSAIRFAEDSTAPSDLYLRGESMKREFERLMLILEESFQLRWEVRDPVEGDRAEIADAILAGNQGALDSISGDIPAAEDVSRECARRLFARAAVGGPERITDNPLWAPAQGAVSRLAELEGAMSHHLALAFLEASLFEVPPLGEGRAERARSMALGTASWLARSIPRRLEWEIESRSPYGFSTYSQALRHALWKLPGAEGLEWVGRIVRTDDRIDELVREGLGTSFPSDGPIFDHPDPWSEQDALERLDAIADAAPVGWWTALAVLSWPPRPFSAPAQGRIAHAHATTLEGDSLTERVVANVQGYLTGEDQADLDLFEWDAPSDRRRTVRQILDQAAGSERRRALVAAALDAGRVSAADAVFLAAPLDRSDASTLAELRLSNPAEVGKVDAPDGVLAGGIPYEEPAWTLEVPAGRHPARLITAGREAGETVNAAIEVVFDPSTSVDRWQAIPSASGADGYEVEFGVGLLAVPELFARADAFEEAGGDAAFEDLYNGIGALAIPRPGGPASIAFAVAPQHGTCRSWVGRAADGTAARLVIDLAVAAIDPLAQGVPWD
jgi:hypothetical protein